MPIFERMRLSADEGDAALVDDSPARTRRIASKLVDPLAFPWLRDHAQALDARALADEICAACDVDEGRLPLTRSLADGPHAWLQELCLRAAEAGSGAARSSLKLGDVRAACASIRRYDAEAGDDARSRATHAIVLVHSGLDLDGAEAAQFADAKDGL